MESERASRANSGQSSARSSRWLRWRKALRSSALAALVIVLVLAIDWGVQHHRQAREMAGLRQESSTFDDQGRRLRYRLQGASKPGPTVVLLSGFAAAVEQWDALQQRLSTLAPVLSYDRGGSGLSDPGLGYDADAQADELARLATIEALELPLVVVGYSSSAFIARAFARRHPALLGGLVLLDPTVPEDVLGKTWGDVYARRAQYERTPLILALKTSFGLRVVSPKVQLADATPAQQRITTILGWSSHWWGAYREGAQIARSAEESALDWSKVRVPIALLSLAQADGAPGSRARYQRHRAMAEESGAIFVNRPGSDHSKIAEDPALLLDLVGVVSGVVNRARAAAVARSSGSATHDGSAGDTQN